MNVAAKELSSYMSDLSEEAYHAGWMMNLEYDLWQAVIEGPRSYGQMLIDETHYRQVEGVIKPMWWLDIFR